MYANALTRCHDYYVGADTINSLGTNRIYKSQTFSASLIVYVGVCIRIHTPIYIYITSKCGKNYWK